MKDIDFLWRSFSRPLHGGELACEYGSTLRPAAACNGGARLLFQMSEHPDSGTKLVLDSNQVQEHMGSWAEAQKADSSAASDETTREEGRLTLEFIKEAEKGEKRVEGEGVKLCETRKRVRPRWLREFVMAERRFVES
ncbi:hypothetical protein L484_006219 [Morus notabilis]|uniref:Uncharacterized protein n=1 Tax=Morus notabilis TaxID=981085 RepID=W9QVD5_9ROSA|nr:hypothetical protein L484_006219 [Morus notabilis]